MTAYPLSESHPDGRGNARFFTAYGFSITRWQELAEALRRHAAEHAVVETVQTALGVRYVVEGVLHVPDGRGAVVRAVWFVERGDDVPVLVTAYPAMRR